MIIRGRSTHSESDGMPEARGANRTAEQVSLASIEDHEQPEDDDGDGLDVPVQVVRVEVGHGPDAQAT